MVEVNGKDVLVGHSADSAYLPLLRRPRLEARTATGSVGGGTSPACQWHVPPPGKWRGKWVWLGEPGERWRATGAYGRSLRSQIPEKPL